MKRNIKRLLIFSAPAALALIYSANGAHAALTSVKVTNPIATSDFSKIVGNTLQWVLSVAGAVALMMLIAGGLYYITAGGSEDRVRTAKKMVTWTILGLVLVLISYALLEVLNRILT